MKPLLALFATCFLFDPAPAPLPASDVPPMQKITPFLWFDDDAEQAIAFYTALFPDSVVLDQSRWGPGGPVPAGTLMTARVRLAGQELMLLNGGPMYPHTEAFSLFVNCETQEEVDDLWAKLSAGGKTNRCAWLDDKFGVTWQIVPTILGKLLQDPDPEKSTRVMKAMMQMDKIDIAGLQRAYEGAQAG